MNTTLSVSLLFLAMTLFDAAFSATDQKSAPRLPDPSGSFAIGRVGYDWTDQSRAEALSDDPKAHREIMVYLWYPAAPANSHSVRAPYLPGAAAIDKSPKGQDLKNGWSDMWPTILSGEIQTHTFENAPIASGTARFPLLIFSHGGGVPTFGYTSQIEDLVSQGYVVAAIEHTYEDGAVAFPDGRVFPLSLKSVNYYKTLGRPETHAWEQGRDDVWAADIRFVLDQVKRLASDQRQTTPFFNRIDLDHIGVFGHSVGGRAVARACQLESRIKACANEDGYLTADGPILVYEGAKLPWQPFLFLQSFVQPPSDEQLASWHLTREYVTRTIAESNASVTKELEGCIGGSYWVIVNLPGFQHYSFTDLPIIRDVGNSANEANDLRALQLVRSYVSAFFDKYLKEKKEPLLDLDSARDPAVEIKRFGRAKPN